MGRRPISTLSSLDWPSLGSCLGSQRNLTEPMAKRFARKFVAGGLFQLRSKWTKNIRENNPSIFLTRPVWKLDKKQPSSKGISFSARPLLLPSPTFFSLFLMIMVGEICPLIGTIPKCVSLPWRTWPPKAFDFRITIPSHFVALLGPVCSPANSQRKMVCGGGQGKHRLDRRGTVVSNVMS